MLSIFGDCAFGVVVDDDDAGAAGVAAEDFDESTANVEPAK